MDSGGGSIERGRRLDKPIQGGGVRHRTETRASQSGGADGGSSRAADAPACAAAPLPREGKFSIKKLRRSAAGIFCDAVDMLGLAKRAKAAAAAALIQGLRMSTEKHALASWWWPAINHFAGYQNQTSPQPHRDHQQHALAHDFDDTFAHVRAPALDDPRLTRPHSRSHARWPSCDHSRHVSFPPRFDSQLSHSTCRS